MSDQDVFSEENKTVDQQENNESVVTSNEDDPIATKLASIVREDGTPKYNNVDKALDALVESQTFIQRLQQENAEIRAREEELSRKANQAEALEDVVRRLKEGTYQEEPKKTETPSGGNDKTNEATVEEQIEQILKKKEANRLAEENLRNVNNQLLEKYGENAGRVVKEKAEELGMTSQELKELAARSPKLVLGHFGVASTTPKPSVGSSVNTSSIKPKEEALERPEKSLLSGPGANTKNVAEYMRKIREKVYQENGIDL